MWPQKVQSGSSQQEVTEAAVELLLEVQLVEWLDEVGMVHVCVNAEHLQEDSLADLEEVLGKTAPPADPVTVVGVGDAREGLLGCDGRVDGKGDAGRIGGEDVGVVDLPGYPPLHEGYVLVCRQFDGLITAVQPCVRVIPNIKCQKIPRVLETLTVIRMRKYLRASGHLRTRGGIANAHAILLLLVDNADEMPEITVMLDNLMGDPLPRLNRLGPGTECHEVALDYVLGVAGIDPGREGPR